MKIANFLTFVLYTAFTLTLSAQVISNARFIQNGNTIRIYYDLTKQTDVKIEFSQDGGAFYENLEGKSVTGDIGRSIAPGVDKCVVWDVLKDRSDLKSEKVCFRITSYDVSRRSFKVGDVSFDMVFVEGGKYTMGCGGQNDCRAEERPAHKVTLDDYYIGECEVTQELWEAVMGVDRNYSHVSADNLPVDGVTWIDAQEFVLRLNQAIGETGFRLPTEAEWEYAARGGKKDRGFTHSGGNDVGWVAWYVDNSLGQPHPVRQKNPNALGVYDMNGNVWEWCEDWYGDYETSSQKNPQGPEGGVTRVLRGGSWHETPTFCRVCTRYSKPPSFRGLNIGLRLVYQIPKEKK